MTLSDPVGAGEIAQRAGVVKATVWSWQKRHSDFPAPWRQLEMGPLWDWAEVEAWLRARTTLRFERGRPPADEAGIVQEGHTVITNRGLEIMNARLAAKQLEQEA